MLEELARQGVGFIALIVVLAAGARGVWVWGWQYRDVARERDEWRRLALSGTDLAEKTVKLVERERRRDEFTS